MIAPKLTMQVVFGNEVTPLVGMREWFDFENGKRGKQRGMVYELLVLSSFDKLSVKVEEVIPIITPEDIAAHNLAMDFVMVTTTGFEASPYVDKAGKMAFSAKADSISIVGTKKDVKA